MRKGYKQNTRKAYYGLVKKYDVMPCDDVVSILTGNNAEAVSTARKSLENAGYEFEPIPKANTKINGNKAGHEWRVTKRPEKIKPTPLDKIFSKSEDEVIERAVELALKRFLELQVNYEQEGKVTFD